MDNKVTVIRPLRRNEFSHLADMAPPEWNSDLSAFMALHSGEPYFHAIVADCGGEIAGVANSVQNGDVGWLGNIIVRPQHRNRGIGMDLTRSLIAYLQDSGCRHQLLIATKMGEGLYRKLGFRVTSRYHFFKGPQLAAVPDEARLRPVAAGDVPAILDLDAKVAGERRPALLAKFFAGGWVHLRHPGRGAVDGFFLPAFAAGLVIARNREAGLSLLHWKHHRKEGQAVVPEANQAAIDFLMRSGFTEYLTAPRMALAEEVRWRPRCIYARASGYCG